LVVAGGGEVLAALEVRLPETFTPVELVPLSCAPSSDKRSVSTKPFCQVTV
jgi:hypothetical protein